MSETVEMVKRLRDETEKDVTIAALAEELKLDKSAAWRRVRSAMDRGYLENLEDRKGRPAKLVEADALPDDIEILPTPERLQGCTVASDSGGVKTNNLLSPLIRHKKRTSTHPPKTTATVQPCTAEPCKATTSVPLVDGIYHHGQECDCWLSSDEEEL